MGNKRVIMLIWSRWKQKKSYLADRMANWKIHLTIKNGLFSSVTQFIGPNGYNNIWLADSKKHSSGSMNVMDWRLHWSVRLIESSVCRDKGNLLSRWLRKQKLLEIAIIWKQDNVLLYNWREFTHLSMVIRGTLTVDSSFTMMSSWYHIRCILLIKYLVTVSFR